jgi:hypothetical protein
VKLELGPGLSLWYGGTITKDCYGHATTVLEMKGEACRDFEERRFFQEENAEQKDRDAIIRKGWLDLLVEARRMEGQCTRVDLPTDDLSGTITTDLIKAKVQNREYTTKMRRLEVTDETDMNLFNGASESLPGYASVLDSKLRGYSATFGSRDSMQLCIYDKAAERTVRGFVVDVKSWIRFEVRYYHKNAEAEIPSSSPPWRMGPSPSISSAASPPPSSSKSRTTAIRTTGARRRAGANGMTSSKASGRTSPSPTKSPSTPSRPTPSGW